MASNMPFKKRTKIKGSGNAAEKVLYNKGAVLRFEHVPTGYEANFSAFIENFSDAYNSEWVAEQVYGRMDPIATFSHTRRAIAVSWKIPAASRLQAKHNFEEVGKLISFLYPLYSPRATPIDSTVINMGPLMRVKYANLIQNAETGGGLLGYLNGFTTDVEQEQGHFISSHGGEDFNLFPQCIILNFEMNVLHEHPLGWTMGAEGKAAFRSGKKGFPYGPGRSGIVTLGNETIPRPKFEEKTPDNPADEAAQQQVLGGQ